MESSISALRNYINESYYYCHWASLVAQRVKRLAVMRKTQVWSLGLEDPLEKEMATHLSILAWRIPWTEEPDRLQSMGARGRGHEEGGSAYAKVRLSLRSPSGNSWASTPKTRVCLLSALCFHLHLWLYRGAVPHYLSLKKRVNLQFQLIKFLGVIVFQRTNSFGSPLACMNRFFRSHVIAQSLPTVRGMKCSKLSKYRFLWAVKRLIRNCIGEGFFTCWANVCC